MHEFTPKLSGKTDSRPIRIARNVVSSHLPKMSFTLYPAIDLRNGQVVRLKQGDPNQQTTYATRPTEAAQRWHAAGAEWIHVINLDGSFGDGVGAAANRSAIQQICALGICKVQTGGGMRTLDDIAAAFDAGATRVVIGTAAVENPPLVGEAIKRYGAEAIVVGLDSKDGMVVTRGWQTGSGILASDLGLQMKEMGAIHALYTEVGRDGLLKGAAAEMTGALAQLTGLSIIASGGVGSLADIEELTQYHRFGVNGVVVGKALYEGRVDLAEALKKVSMVD